MDKCGGGSLTWSWRTAAPPHLVVAYCRLPGPDLHAELKCPELLVHTYLHISVGGEGSVHLKSSAAVGLQQRAFMGGTRRVENRGLQYLFTPY